MDIRGDIPTNALLLDCQEWAKNAKSAHEMAMSSSTEKTACAQQHLATNTIKIAKSYLGMYGQQCFKAIA